MSLRNDNLEVILGGWVEARRRNDADLMRRYLHPDVVWRGVRPDLLCRDRDEVIASVGDGWRPDIEALELVAEGDQVMVGVRSPDLTEIAGEMLDGQIYNVFTIADGLIVRIAEYRTRDEALAVMHARREAAAVGGEPPRRMPEVPVDGLIPFVHVHDVAGSVAFYQLLGFVVTDSYSVGDRLDWAALQSADARLMLAHAEEPIHSRDQAILFYLYTRDLQALQTHLRTHGVPAGAIRDGSPGPRAEMRVTDP